MVNKNLLKKESKGQALLLIIIVLFIVFFLVVSVSGSISIDTQNTINNGYFQEAYTYAQAGLNYGKALIADSSSPITTVQNQQLVLGQGSTFFSVIPFYYVNQIVGPDKPVQASVTGATTVTVSFDDKTSVLMTNVTYTNDTNVFCIYYPSTLNLSTDGVTLSNFKNPNTGVCGATQSLIVQPDGKTYQATITPGANSKYVRAMLFNYSGDSADIIINTNPAQTVPQEYEIVGTGDANGSRRTLRTYYSVYGNPPGIFDYVLFNGGNGASISF